jgi:hypothetical protein
VAVQSRVTPTGWSQYDDATDQSRATPTGWEQIKGEGGGGYTHPTLSAVTATNIGPNSFQPRVTYQF